MKGVRALARGWRTVLFLAAPLLVSLSSQIRFPSFVSFPWCLKKKKKKAKISEWLSKIDQTGKKPKDSKRRRNSSPTTYLDGEALADHNGPPRRVKSTRLHSLSLATLAEPLTGDRTSPFLAVTACKNSNFVFVSSVTTSCYLTEFRVINKNSECHRKNSSEHSYALFILLRELPRIRDCLNLGLTL